MLQNNQLVHYKDFPNPQKETVSTLRYLQNTYIQSKNKNHIKNKKLAAESVTLQKQK